MPTAIEQSQPPMLKQKLPRTLVRARRTELTAAPMTVLEGALPTDLRGHLLVNTAVGSPAHDLPLPAGEVTTILNGDGYLQRFDFAGDATAVLTTRLAKTLSYWADVGCEADPEFHNSVWRFFDHGLLRFSVRLGLRNMVNTAFLPFNFAGDATRLLVTWDAGRPWEVDPVTLKLVTPVGSRSEWHAEAMKAQPFATIFGTAHPTWDEHTGEGFFVNYGKGMDALMETFPLVHAAAEATRTVAFQSMRLLEALRMDSVADGCRKAWRNLGRLRTQGTQNLPAFIDGMLPEMFTYLVRWDGKGALERFLLVGREGIAISIKESVHQVCVTRNWVILLDTGFKISLSSMFDQPLQGVPQIEQILRGLVTRPMESDLTLYIVARKDLVNGAHPGDGESHDKKVRCHVMTIASGAVHFLADYDDTDDLLTLHVAHAAATDVAEWVRPYDRQTWANRKMSPPDIAGMMAMGAWDINRVAKYVVHAPTACLRSAQVLASDPETWAVGLYAGRGLCAPGHLPNKITDLYWFSLGCFPELNTRFVRDTYIHAANRMQSMEALRVAQLTGGKPACLFRVATAKMEIADRYLFEFGLALSSPQFIPRHGGDGGPTDGYLTAVVWTPDDNQLWVWDAADLAGGPVCKLVNPQWMVAFTMHSAWMPTLEPRTANYGINVHQELDKLAGDDAKLKALFDRHVAPNFDKCEKSSVKRVGRQRKKSIRREILRRFPDPDSDKMPK